VAGRDSEAAARLALPVLGKDTIYVDTGTTSPDDLRRLATDFAAADRALLDVAIMGAIALAGAACPVLAAGPAATQVEAVFDRMGAAATALPDSAVGDASSLKLLRSVIVKGLECLAVESLTAAESLGVREQLYAVFQDIDAAGFVPFVEALLRTHAPHAERRGHEMEDAAAQLRALGFDALITSALPARYQATQAANLSCEARRTVAGETDLALSWLHETVLLKEDPAR